jgi:hypothetical protein
MKQIEGSQLVVSRSVASMQGRAGCLLVCGTGSGSGVQMNPSMRRGQGQERGKRARHCIGHRWKA